MVWLLVVLLVMLVWLFASLWKMATVMLDMRRELAELQKRKPKLIETTMIDPLWSMTLDTKTAFQAAREETLN